MFIEDILIENNRARLSILKQDDFENLVHFAIQEPEIWKYSFDKIAGSENFKKYIVKAVNNKELGNEIPFIIYDKEANSYAGCSRFYDINDNQKTLKIGYTWYGNSFQQTGINRHCKFLMLMHAFKELEMERVGFEVNNKNQKSISSLEKLGCTNEGIMRSTHYNIDGTRRDTAMYSILRSDWNNGIREKIKSLLK